MKKVCKKRIFVIFSIMMVSFVMFSFFASNVNAEINPNTEGVDIADGINKVVEKFQEANITFNSVVAAISAGVGGLAILIYFSIAGAFSAVTGSVLPAPDNIIFNRMAILDVNFFNPNGNSIIGKAGGVVQQIYNSFHTIAISIFIIAAMIVGIKMALSAVASEKAQAKKALTNWLTGIIILFLMRLIIAAIFEANEYIVWKISGTSENVNFPIVYTLDFTIIGTNITKVIASAINVLTPWKAEAKIDLGTMSGYSGMLMMFAVNAFSGDIFSAILFFVIIGQTVTLFVAYAKRLMYAIILGVCAPLVVAVDTINKSLKGQSTILSNWFKEFVGIVFIQIFHSLLMLVTLNVLATMADSKAADVNGNTAFIGIASIVLTSGIVKFEKLYKQIFGISDGMLGGLKGQAGKIMQTAAGVSTAVKAIGDNGKKIKQSIKSKDEAREKLKIAQEKSSETRVTNALDKIQIAAQVEKDPEKRKQILEGAGNLIQEAENLGYNPDTLKNFKRLINNLKSGTYAQNMVGSTGSNVRMSPITSQSVNTNYQNSSNTSNTNTNISNTNNSSSNQFSEGMSAGNSNGNSAIIQSNKDIQAEIAKLRKEISSNSKGNSIAEMDKKVKAAEKEISQANKNLGSAVIATAMSPINLAAGIGFGLGAGEDMAGSALKGGMVTAGLDLAAEKIGGQIGKAVSNSVSKEVRNGMKNLDKHSNVGDI